MNNNSSILNIAKNCLNIYKKNITILLYHSNIRIIIKNLSMN
jgi:hypothetical protein